MGRGQSGKPGGDDPRPERFTRAEEFGHYPGDARSPQRESKQRQARDRSAFWDGCSREQGEQGDGVAASKSVGCIPHPASQGLVKVGAGVGTGRPV